MMTTKYQIAEMCGRILNKGNYGPNSDFGQQELIVAVSQVFASVVKASYFQNKADGVSEISGTFVYSFKNQPVLLDNDLNLYYSVLPSTYIDLPNESGITFVGTMQSGNKSQSQSEPMVRVFNNFPALSRGLAVENLQTRKAFYTEGANIYYIGMTAQQAALNVLIKLAVSLQGIDEDTQVNIPPEMQDQIINLVVARYMPELKESGAKTGDQL